jgi:hypothetical protein
LAIDDGHAGTEAWFFALAYTDPNSDLALMRAGEDEGRRYVSVNQAAFGEKIDFTIASHIFGDPQFQGPPGASLVFDCKGGFESNGLTLSLTEREWTPSAINYKAKLARQEVSGGWRTVLVPLSRFLDSKGASPGNWSQVDRIQISGVTSRAEPPLFSRFRWVQP